ncbi:MAG: YfhO family protein [Oscillospiraceae bacterium]|nr:YfhO family protein [Oscillospiraceae bacterium]
MSRKSTKLFSWKLCIPPLIVLACVLTVYAIHGIFPFGTESIVYDDMGQCSVPIFYTVWDALHGSGSIFFNFRTAAGIFISSAYESVLSPLNTLFFLLCPRDSILESMSFFLLCKLMIASFTAMLLFRYRFQIRDIWQILFGVLYAFNPFLLQYYSNASWMELVMLFPLVLLGADRLFQCRKPLLYIVSLSYCLIMQLYIAYMIVLFLFLSGGIYIGLLLPKAQRKGAVLRFGVSSVLSILISAFSALPTYFYMTASSRYQNTKNYFQILMSTASNPRTKEGMLLILTALPFALTFLLFLNFRKEKKTIAFFGMTLALFLIPIVFENVNLMWHMGSYVNFSMRYAFMFHLMLLLSAAYFLHRFPDRLYQGTKHSRIFITALSLFAFAVNFVLLFGLYENAEKGLISKSNEMTIWILFLLDFAFFALLLKFGHKTVSCILISCFLLWESGFYFNRAVNTGSARNFEYSLDYIEECDNIYTALPIERDNLSRVKNIDGTLNSNYPLIADCPSMSNFTHIIPASIKRTMQKLGYSSVYTRILDTGGTLFTDALLGYKYTLSLNPLSHKDYSYIGTAGRYLVYENKYTLPFGMVGSTALLGETIFETTAYQTQNNLWHEFSQSDSDLLTIPETQEKKSDSVAIYELDVEGTKELYLVCKGSTKRKNMQIYVNGEPIHVPSLGEPDNTRYNTRFNNSLLDIGEFTDTHVTIRVELLNSTITMSSLETRIALLDKAALQQFCLQQQDAVTAQAGARSLTITASAQQKDQVLFLPLTYDSGWTCKVNGKTVEADVALGTFMAIPLEKGQNEITMTFLPKGFKIGAFISILSLIACAFWCWKQKIWTEKADHSSPLLLGFYYALDYGTIVAIYLVPMICRVYTFLTH